MTKPTRPLETDHATTYGRWRQHLVIALFASILSLNFVQSERSPSRTGTSSADIPKPWQLEFETKKLEMTFEGTDPKDRRSPSYARAISRLAHDRLQSGRYEEAETLAKEALRIRRATLEDGHPDLGDSLHQLALIHYVRGWHAVARDLLEDAIRIREASLGPNHLLLAESLAESGLVHIALGDTRTAGVRLNRALAIAKKAEDRDLLLIASILGRVSVLRAIEKRHDEAIDLALESLRIHSALAGHRWPGVASSLDTLRRIDESIALPAPLHRAFRLLVDAVDESNAIPNRYTASTHNTLGLIYWAAGDKRRAEESFERAVADIRRCDDDHPLESRALLNLGRFLASLHRGDEAREALIDARDISRRVLRPDHTLNHTIEQSIAALPVAVAETNP